MQYLCMYIVFLYQCIYLLYALFSDDATLFYYLVFYYSNNSKKGLCFIKNKYH